MPDSTSQLFYAALESHRHRLWSIALAGGGDAIHAEALLLKFLRAKFAVFAQNPAGQMDLVALFAGEVTTAGSGSFDAEAAMPAAVWSRLWGAIQIDAAGLGTSKNLRLDSVLLSPDPLLAPKKPKKSEDFSDVVPPSRMFLVATLLVLLAFVVILFLSTRRTVPPSTEPAPTGQK